MALKDGEQPEKKEEKYESARKRGECDRETKTKMKRMREKKGKNRK